jgi:hypothetical protein
MFDWLNRTAGEGYASAILWTLGALVLLVIVLFAIRFARSMNGGTFVAGGRNRRHRLAVLDATAVDTHRRLVLVRRDDVEHLILIGGPTDVVVEQNIRAHDDAPSVREAPVPPRPAPEPRPEVEAAPRPAPRPTPVRESPVAPPAVEAAPQRPVQPAPVAPPARPAPAVAQPRPAPPVVRRDPPVAAPAPVRREPPAPVVPPAPPRREPVVEAEQRSEAQSAGNDLDAALLEELQVTLDDGGRNAAADPNKLALEDEMNRLLDDLSDPRRA